MSSKIFSGIFAVKKKKKEIAEVKEIN